MEYFDGETYRPLYPDRPEAPGATRGPRGRLRPGTASLWRYACASPGRARPCPKRRPPISGPSPSPGSPRPDSSNPWRTAFKGEFSAGKQGVCPATSRGPVLALRGQPERGPGAQGAHDPAGSLAGKRPPVPGSGPGGLTEITPWPTRNFGPGPALFSGAACRERRGPFHGDKPLNYNIFVHCLAQKQSPTHRNICTKKHAHLPRFFLSPLSSGNPLDSFHIVIFSGHGGKHPP